MKGVMRSSYGTRKSEVQYNRTHLDIQQREPRSSPTMAHNIMEISDSAISVDADGRLMTRPEKGRRDPQYLNSKTPHRWWCCNALGRRGYGIPMYGPCQTIPRRGMRELHGRWHRIEGGPSSYQTPVVMARPPGVRVHRRIAQRMLI